MKDSTYFVKSITLFFIKEVLLIELCLLNFFEMIGISRTGTSWNVPIMFRSTGNISLAIRKNGNKCFGNFLNKATKSSVVSEIVFDTSSDCLVYSNS